MLALFKRHPTPSAWLARDRGVARSLIPPTSFGLGVATQKTPRVAGHPHSILGGRSPSNAERVFYLERWRTNDLDAFGRVTICQPGVLPPSPRPLPAQHLRLFQHQFRRPGLLVGWVAIVFQSASQPINVHLSRCSLDVATRLQDTFQPPMHPYRLVPAGWRRLRIAPHPVRNPPGLV